MSTSFDVHREHLTVPWTEPVPSSRTTFDLANEQLTVEDRSVQIGDTQVHGGELFRYDGKRWISMGEA
jgi:hypothetical protein